MKKTSVVWLVLVQFVLAYEWLHSGWGKWASSGFMDNIDKTFGVFISKNPHLGYTTFLQDTVLPNAQIFGNLIRTSEMAVGIAFLLAGILLLAKKQIPILVTWVLVVALIGATIMNINFYLASGWSNPSTAGINLVMGAISLILAIFYITNRDELAI